MAIAVGVCALLFLPRFRVLVHRIWMPLSIKSGDVSASVATVKYGQIAPDFALRDAKDAIIRLSTYRGRVVLLNFWATWCTACRMEIPWFIAFEDKYKSRGLAIIGVSLDDTGWNSVKPFLRGTKLDVNYPIVVGNEVLAKRYGVESLPMTLLIDRDVRIAASRVGDVNNSAHQGYETEIVKLLTK